MAVWLGRFSARDGFLISPRRGIWRLSLDGIQRPLAGHTLELVHPTLGEGMARAQEDAVHRVRHEDLARLRGGHHPGAEMHRQATDPAVLTQFHLTGMK